MCLSARVKLKKYYFHCYACRLVSRSLLLFLLLIEIFTFYFYSSIFFGGTFTSRVDFSGSTVCIYIYIYIAYTSTVLY